MKRKTSNKKIIIITLIILLLVLAVGYAIFSDTLTILGTANAKGTFDLEFQNAEVVKVVGADAEKTTAEISADKNTLTVKAGDLSYPGAGAEYSVDIVNVGTMPAEVQALIPTNITGSDKIKVTGLDTIKTDHPKIEVGGKCNIHFTVEWPADVGEISESESSISFGLQIEYTQATVEVFDGNVTHTDIDVNGNIIRNTTIEEPTVKEGKLTEIIEPADYGKSINYKATVQGQEVSNWKVLYNDKSNIYIILDDFLPNNLVPTSAGLDTEGTYVVNSQTSRNALLNGLKTESYWSAFANGVGGDTATGAPTLNMLITSYNQKHGTNLNTLVDSTAGSRILDNTDTLYVPHNNTYNDVNLYWLATVYTTDVKQRSLWVVNYAGNLHFPSYNAINSGIRPVVCLTSTLVGRVEETVEIN